MRSLCTFTIIFATAWHPVHAQKVTYEQDIRPLFQDSCFKCHNPDKEKGGLNLTTMNAVLAGGGSGAVVVPGDPDASLLYLAMTHAEEPFMPPKASKRPEAELALVRKWIAGGVLANDSSVALKAKRPSVSLAQSDISADRPKGPAPLPADMLLEPVHVPRRADAIVALAANPWAPVTAMGSESQVLLHHSGTRALLGILPFPEGDVYDLRFSRNGQLLLVAGGISGKSGIAVVFDARSGERLLDVMSGYDAVLSADLSADQRFVATGGTDKFIRVFDLASGAERHKIKKHTQWVTAVAFSPDGVLLATGDRNGNLHVWEAVSGQVFYTLKGHSKQITELAWRRDSNILASASEDGSIRLWSMHNGRQARTWKSHGDGVLAIDYFPNGKLVTCGRDGLARVWNGEGKEQAAVSLPALPFQICAGTDNKTVVIGDFDGVLHVADVAGQLLGHLNTVPPTLDTRLARAREALGKATTDLRRDEAHATQSAQTHKDALAKRTVLRTKLDASRASLTTATASLKALEGMLARNDGPMNEAAKKAQSARQAAETCDGELASVLQRRDVLLKEIEALIKVMSSNPTNLPAVSLTQKRKDVETVKSLVDARTLAHQEALARLQAADSALGSVQKKTLELKQQVDEGRQKVNHLVPENETAQAALTLAEKGLAESTVQRDAALKKKSEANIRVETMQTEVARWELAKFNLSVHASRAALREKDAVLNAQEEALQNARAEAAQQKAEFERLQKKFEAMKAAVGI